MLITSHCQFYHKLNKKENTFRLKTQVKRSTLYLFVKFKVILLFFEKITINKRAFRRLRRTIQKGDKTFSWRAYGIASTNAILIGHRVPGKVWTNVNGHRVPGQIPGVSVVGYEHGTNNFMIRWTHDYFLETNVKTNKVRQNYFKVPYIITNASSTYFECFRL